MIVDQGLCTIQEPIDLIFDARIILIITASDLIHDTGHCSDVNVGPVGQCSIDMFETFRFHHMRRSRLHLRENSDCVNVWIEWKIICCRRSFTQTSMWLNGLPCSLLTVFCCICQRYLLRYLCRRLQPAAAKKPNNLRRRHFFRVSVCQCFNLFPLGEKVIDNMTAMVTCGKK